ncbi:MAG: FmdB family zinc ribbon protein [Pseudonocardiaceae bacterium]
MPTYSYACTACEHHFDTVQKFTDSSLTDCPECSGRLRKLFSSVGIVFKGSGFYRTDSRASSSAGSESTQSGSSESSSNGKSEPGSKDNNGKPKPGSHDKSTPSTSGSQSESGSASSASSSATTTAT